MASLPYSQWPSSEEEEKKEETKATERTSSTVRRLERLEAVLSSEPPDETTAEDIAHIVSWQPNVVLDEANVTPESAAEELERFRMRAGGDVSSDFRDGYRSWRLGRSTGATENSAGVVGCHPAARREATMERADDGAALYPRLAPAEWNTARYWWRYTLSYWVATCFMIGSVLFVCGAAFDYVSVADPIRQSATVQWPYFIGGLFFISGSYLGYFAAVNLGRREDQKPRYVVCFQFFRRRIPRRPDCLGAALLPEEAPHHQRLPSADSSLEEETSTTITSRTSASELGNYAAVSPVPPTLFRQTQQQEHLRLLNDKKMAPLRDAPPPEEEEEEDAPRLDVEPDAWHSYWGYLAYLVGAFWFQVMILVQILEARNVVAEIDTDDPETPAKPPGALGELVAGTSPRAVTLRTNVLTAVPATLGGLLFTVGACFACHINETWRPSGAFTDVAWWVSNVNFLGSVLFLEAGVFLFDGAPQVANVTPSFVIQLPYLVGSACFFLAAMLELFMWRVDLHGLSFVRAINKTTKLPELVRTLLRRDPLQHDPLQFDDDVSGISLNQLGFVVTVVLTYAFSLMDLVFAAGLRTCAGEIHRRRGAYDIYDSAVQSLICFGALALASVVHTVPRQRPFGMLLWTLRVTMLLLLLRYVWKFVDSWHDASHTC